MRRSSPGRPRKLRRRPLRRGNSIGYIDFHRRALGILPIEGRVEFDAHSTREVRVGIGANYAAEVATGRVFGGEWPRFPYTWLVSKFRKLRNPPCINKLRQIHRRSWQI